MSRQSLIDMKKCEHCGHDLEFVEGREPYTTDYLICPRCNSTYNLNGGNMNITTAFYYGFDVIGDLQGDTLKNVFKVVEIEGDKGPCPIFVPFRSRMFNTGKDGELRMYNISTKNLKNIESVEELPAEVSTYLSELYSEIMEKLSEAKI